MQNIPLTEPSDVHCPCHQTVVGKRIGAAEKQNAKPVDLAEDSPQFWFDILEIHPLFGGHHAKWQISQPVALLHARSFLDLMVYINNFVFGFCLPVMLPLVCIAIRRC